MMCQIAAGDLVGVTPHGLETVNHRLIERRSHEGEAAAMRSLRHHRLSPSVELEAPEEGLE